MCALFSPEIFTSWGSEGVNFTRPCLITAQSVLKAETLSETYRSTRRNGRARFARNPFIVHNTNSGFWSRCPHHRKCKQESSSSCGWYVKPEIAALLQTHAQQIAELRAESTALKNQLAASQVQLGESGPDSLFAKYRFSDSLCTISLDLEAYPQNTVWQSTDYGL